MHRTNLALLATLLLLPLSLAHNPAGTPKNYCEPEAEWQVHDYALVAPPGKLNSDGQARAFSLDAKDGAPAASGFIFGFLDGNVGSDCDGTGAPLADHDGHAEFAAGGAWLLVYSGAGVRSADPNVGAGTLYCFGDAGHHATFATVQVEDVVLGPSAEATIASDTVDFLGDGEGCGDFQSDKSVTGVGTVTTTFPPGLDGSYQVYVLGVAGHVFTD